METSKEKIATDIDEVLFPLVEEFVKWHNREYGTSLTVEDFRSYEFEEALGLPVPEVVYRIKLFLDQEHGHLHVEPIYEAKEAITEMSNDFDFVGITARHPSFKISTIAYVEHHFGDIITDLHLLGHKETVDVVIPKAEVCRRLGASTLVDDSLGHVENCDDFGVQGILFGDYPWNQHENIPDSVIACPTWGEVLEYAYAKA